MKMDEWILESYGDVDVSEYFVINEHREYSIGRRQEYDIVSVSPLVSRNHGILTLKPNGKVYVKDLQSSNGTYVNDQKILPFEDVVLKQNDIIGIGAPTTAIERRKEIFVIRYKPRKRIKDEVETPPIEEINFISIPEKDVPKTVENTSIPSEIEDLEQLSDPGCSKTIIKANIVPTDEDLHLNNDKNEHCETANNKILKSNVKCNDQESSISKQNVPEKDTIDSKLNEIIESKKNDALEDKVRETFGSDLFISDKILETIDAELSRISEKSEDVKPNPEHLNSLIQEHNLSGNIIICSSSDEESIGPKDKLEESSKSKNDCNFTQNEEDDIVVVSDDDSDIFPMSQLFHVSVKEEPQTEENPKTENCISPVISDVSDEINHENIFNTVKEEVDDYDEIDDDELDEECMSWYNKLSQSQDLITCERKQEKISVEEDEDSGDGVQKDDQRLENVLDEQLESREASDADEQPIIKEVPTVDVTAAEKGDKNEKCTKKLYTKPPVIDAPFLLKGKRKAHEDKSKENKNSSKRRKSVHDETPSTSAVNIDKSEKKSRKRKKSVDICSKDEKIKIQKDRKKKLKELASKSQTTKKKEDYHKSHTKPKVKVSSGRGLFLTDSNEASLKKKIDEALEDGPEAKKKFIIPKKTNSDLNKTTTPAKITKKHKLSFSDLRTDSKVKDLTEPSTVKEKQIVETKENHKKSNISPPNKNKIKKHVRFIEEPEIKYIEKLPGNSCRKVIAKDASMPIIHNNNIASDEIISTVLEWRPAWLEEQKKLSASPQVSKRTPLRMLTNFNTIGDYFHIVIPLMLLELWKSVFRDWCSINAPVRMACIDDIIEKRGNSYVNCYCLVENNDLDYPKWGDLMLIEYYFMGTDYKIATNKKFGYVINSNKRRMMPYDVVNKRFSEIGAVPPFKVSFTLKLKRSQVQIIQEKLVRVRFVSRMSPSLRIFKSVSYLQNSPLCSLILKPSIHQYKIFNPIQMTSAIEDKLNNDQLMCVYEAYQICCRNEPGIYLIQGPPGTGKSFVIKNLIRQLLCDDKKNQVQQKPRILLCAPSNGAVDEIANTLLDMRSKLNKNERFKMVRVGPPSSITHPKVKSISVSELVRKHLQANQNNNLKTNGTYMNDEYNFLMQKETTIKDKIMSLEARSLDCSSELQNLKKVSAQIEQLKTNSSSHQDKKKEERDAETVMIEKADIICTTLSSCIGSSSRLEELVAEKRVDFTCCIIDEATQSNEQESLIPLILGIKRFVLVGDPEQLPPTTISQEAKDLGHGKSLFGRIKCCFDHLPDNPIRMLTEQYRMHPAICKFPNDTFYAGKLKTADIVVERTENILEPYILFSLNNNINFKESEYLNKDEANLVLLLTEIVTKRTRYNVGIITPYSKQKEYLVNEYRSIRAKDKENIEDDDRHLSRVSINTVDGFQGQERDVIIISSVRYKSNIFLNDLQRLNVALTRAKHAVFICAHTNLFRNQSIWQNIESDIKTRGFFYPITESDTTDEKYISELILKRS